MSGGAGYRSLCLLHAKQALYHLSYTPSSTHWSPQTGTATKGDSMNTKKKEKEGLRQPGVEPGAKAWEASMLPIHHWRSCYSSDLKKSGGAGFRSLCLPIANRPLYRVSYTPRHTKAKKRCKLWGSNPCLFRDWRLKPAP